MAEIEPHVRDFEAFLAGARQAFERKWQSKMIPNSKLSDFKRVKTLGTGSFGRVMLVKHKKTKKPYAMKILEKDHVVKKKQVDHTISEIKLLNALKFDFVVGLDFFFVDNVYIYLAMPFINGGEMFTHLRSMKKYDEKLAKFYAAQVILAFQYLHYLGLVYRDLKPENILIDRDGYLKLTDLGFCKKIDDNRTWTLCGTPEYLAPEVILSKGYNYGVDWWGLGVLIYEMCAGYPPFFARDPVKIYERIVAGKFTIPPHFSKSLRELVPKILEVDRTRRLGNLKNGVNDIKGHSWYKGFDWNAVWHRQIAPSFVPRVTGAEDCSNFEPFEEEELRSASRDECGEYFDSLYAQS